MFQLMDKEIITIIDHSRALKRDFIYNMITVLEKGIQAFIYINYKIFDKHRCSSPTGSFFCSLHQYFELERPKGHYLEFVVHLYHSEIWLILIYG